MLECIVIQETRDHEIYRPGLYLVLTPATLVFSPHYHPDKDAIVLEVHSDNVWVIGTVAQLNVVELLPYAPYQPPQFAIEKE